MLEILLFLTLGTLIFCVLGLLIVPAVLRPSKEAQRVVAVVQSTRPDRRPISRKEHFQEGLLRISQALRVRLGIQVSQKSLDLLAAAGYQGSRASDYFFAAQCLTPLAGAFAGSFVPQNTLFWVFLFTVLGYLAPNFWLTEKTRSRKERIRRSLPDAMDLMVICVDAGLGLDQALLRVSEEIAISHPELQQELTRVHLEQRAGRPRLESWQSLAARTRIPELTSFVGMLAQADRFGTPIVKTLSTFADDIRLKRRQRAEEAAAKTKIKIIFPLVFFIFPCLFIVLLGPAVLSMIHSFNGMNR
ncbi:MAG: type II secretion system F family protein [Acidobacterium ailaaui]|nr:type II secretion system F family protein [Pseudacidobacterium ailaaui]